MGAGQSSTGPPKTALHILRIAPQSPAARTSLEPFFDFIAGCNGAPLALDDLERVVEAHEGRPLELVVWSSKTRQTRLVPIIPSRAWSANSPTTTSKPSLLGLSMRLCAPAHALESVWHVLDVLEGSPGESAGLVPYGDWIVGWSGGALKREQDFYDLIEEHEERPLRVYVYSYDFDTLREVVLVPNRHWGGEGLLGCVFGFGLLHRIPDLPADDPQNVIFRGSGDAFSEDGVSPVDRSAPVSGTQSESGMFVPADEYGEEDFHFPAQHSSNGYSAHVYDHHSHVQYALGYDEEGQEAQYAGYTLDESLPSGYPAVHDDEEEDFGEAERTFVLQAPPRSFASQPPHSHASGPPHSHPQLPSHSHPPQSSHSPLMAPTLPASTSSPPPPPQSALAERGSPVSALPGSPPVATPAVPRPVDNSIPPPAETLPAALHVSASADVRHSAAGPPSPDPRAHLPPPSTRSIPSSAATPMTALDPTPRAPPPTALDPPSPDPRAPIPSMPLHPSSRQLSSPSPASLSPARVDDSGAIAPELDAPQLHAPTPLPAHAHRPPTVVPPWSPAHTPRPVGATRGSPGASNGSPGEASRASHGGTTKGSPDRARALASPGPTPRGTTFIVGARASPPPTFTLGASASPPPSSPSTRRGSIGPPTFTLAPGARASSPLSPPTPPPAAQSSMMRGAGVGLGARTFSGRGGWGGFAARAPIGAASRHADADLESVDGDTTSVDGDTTSADGDTETETETERSDVE